jgi:hypothetical protein
VKLPSWATVTKARIWRRSGFIISAYYCDPFISIV